MIPFLCVRACSNFMKEYPKGWKNVGQNFIYPDILFADGSRFFKSNLIINKSNDLYGAVIW